MVLNNQFNLGLILAFFVVFFDSIYDVLTRVASVALDVKPMVFVSIVYIAAAMSMLIIAGVGKLGTKTLKDPFTWIFSFLNINLTFIFLYLFQYVTTTEGNLLVRFCIAMSFILNIIFTNKKHYWYDLVGIALTTIGCFIIVQDLNVDNKVVVVLLSIAYASILSLRALIGEFHKPSNEAENIKDRFRVTGYIMLVTGSAFLSLSLFGAFLNELSPDLKNIAVIGNIIPQFSDFLHAKTIAFATFMGLLIQMPSMFFFFYACVVGRSEIVITMTAFLPPLTLGVEYIFHQFGLLTMETLSTNDIWGGSLIVVSGFFLLFMKYKDKDKKTETKVQSNDTDYDMVCSALRFCDDDMLLCAKKLGVEIEELETVYAYKGEVGFKVSGDKHRIILRNYHRNIATADQLTGLSSKDSLINAMEGMLSERKTFTLIYIDLDRFKPINDTYGHEIGDDVLRTIGSRMTNNLPSNAIAARLGGDEFAIMMRDSDRTQAKTLMSTLLSELERDIDIKELKTPISVGASYGIAQAFHDANIVKDLFNKADENMYENKKKRKAAR